MRRAIAVLFVVACGSSTPGPSPTPGATQQKCTNLGLCNEACSSGTCDVTCAGATECDTSCSGGSRCGVVDCRGSTTCNIQCSGGSPCDYIDCDGVTGCDVNCSGGSPCDVNCHDATACDLICSGGSPCLALCTGATQCTFKECSGGSGETSCPNDVIVCNRACPKCGDGVCDRIAGETTSSCSSDCH
jgi:hypothetical protein